MYIHQLPLCVLAVICFFGTGLGYLDMKARWLMAGVIGHIALTVACVAIFGFANFLSGVFLVWTAGLLLGGVMIGYLDMRPAWMAFGITGAVPLASIVAWGYGA